VGEAELREDERVVEGDFTQLLVPPDLPPWPAGFMSILRRSGLSSVLVALSFATHLAGPQYMT